MANNKGQHSPLVKNVVLYYLEILSLHLRGLLIS